MLHSTLLVKSAQVLVMLSHLLLIILNYCLCWEGSYARKSVQQYDAKWSKFLGFSVPWIHIEERYIFPVRILGTFILLSCVTQSRPDEDAASEIAVAAVNQVPVSQHVATSASDDYFQTVVITSLLAILKDQALSSHHHTVIEAIMSIFKTQGLKCVTFLPQVRFH